MDWEYIEIVFAQDIEFTRVSRDEIFDALCYLEQEFGLDWIKATKASISNSSALGRMIQFVKCHKVADVIANGSVLKKKLRATYVSQKCQDAIAEALTAERLLTSGATVQYEPQLPGIAKRPDLIATWQNQQVAFEVTFPLLSVQDETENQHLNKMLSQCSALLTSGTLNIYLTEVSITPEIIASVVEAVRQLSSDTTNCHLRFKFEVQL